MRGLAKFLLGTALVLSMPLLYARGEQPAASPPKAAAAEPVQSPSIPYTCEKEEIRVGVIADFSGESAEYGTAIRNGIEIARSEDPALFRCLQFFYEDDRGDPQRAAVLYQELLAGHQVSLVYQWGDQSTIAIARVAARFGVPLVTMSGLPGLGAMNLPYVIRFMNSRSDWWGGFGRYLKLRHFRTLFVFENEEPGPQEDLDQIRGWLDGIKVTSLGKVSRSTDIRSLVTRAKEQSANPLLLSLTPSQIVEFIKGADEIGFHPKYFGTQSLESRSKLASVWPMLEGTQTLQLAVSGTFRERYEKRFSSSDQLPAAWNAFQFAQLIGDAFDNVKGRPTSEDILAFFRNPNIGVGSMLIVQNSSESYARFPLAIEMVDDRGTRTVGVYDVLGKYFEPKYGERAPRAETKYGAP